MGKEPGGIVRGLVLALAVATVSCEPTQKSEQKDLPKSNQVTSATAVALPLVFEVNRGQTDPRVHYLARNPAYTLFLTSDGAVLSTLAPREKKRSLLQRAKGENGSALRRVVTTMKLVGAAANAKPAGEDRRPGKVNYFIGKDPKGWRVGIPVYGRVRYRGVYPGIDLAYIAERGSLSYEFIVAPGAQAATIGLAFPGAKGLKIDANGDLVVVTDGGGLRHTAPRLYQVRNNRRLAVEGKFVLKSDRVAGFKVGAHDPSLPLVIDPTIIDFTTYFGGSANEGGGNFDFGVPDITNSTAIEGSNFDLDVDSDGRLFVTGTTFSDDFPKSDATELSGDFDAFVMRVDFAGGTPVLGYATYLGGSEWDRGHGIAAAGGGAAYVAGTTFSDDFPTPETPTTPYQTNLNTEVLGWDAFIAKLDVDGTVVRGTYLGQSGFEWARDIAVDLAGGPGYAPAVYVAGTIWDLDLETTLATDGAVQTQSAGLYDAFVARLDPDLSQLTYFTYLGGTSYDHGNGIAVHDGNIFVAGHTYSNDFPTTSNAAQPDPGVPPPFDVGCNPDGPYPWQAPIACGDAFIARIDPSAGTPLIYSTYLGGLSFEAASAIAVDGGGAAYITGTADSGLPDRRYEILIAKLDGDGQEVYRHHYGGTFDEAGTDITVEPGGRIHITGWTRSDGLATPGALQTGLASTGTAPEIIGNWKDAFHGIYGAVGLLQSFNYFGGNYDDDGQAIALDGDGIVYIGGSTDSTNLIPVAALQSERNGNSDIFLARFVPAEEFALELTKTVAPAEVDIGTVVDYWINLDNQNDSVIPGVTLTDQLPPALQFSGLTVTATIGTSCVYDAAAHSVICAFNGIPPGNQPGILPGPSSVHTTATVSGTNLTGIAGELCNVAQITGSNIIGDAPTAQDCHSGTAQPVELSVNVTRVEPPPPALPFVGDEVRYRIQVTNAGLFLADCVQLTAVTGISGGPLTNEGTTPAECQAGGQCAALPGLCLGSLQPGAEATARFAGKTPAAGVLSFVAIAQSGLIIETGNAAVQVVGVQAQLSVSLAPPESSAAGWFKVPITITTTAPLPSVDVQVTYTEIDAPVTRVYGYAPGDETTCAPDEEAESPFGVGCHLFNFSGTRVLDVYFESDSPPTVAVRVTGPTEGDDPADNQASVP